MGQVIWAPQNRWFNARNMTYICGLAASHFDPYRIKGFDQHNSGMPSTSINLIISSQHCLVGGSSLDKSSGVITNQVFSGKTP
jgi:hypothetical protein